MNRTWTYANLPGIRQRIHYVNRPTEKSPKVCKNGLGRIHHEKMNPRSFIVVLEKCTDKLQEQEHIRNIIYYCSICGFITPQVRPTFNR